MTFPQPNSNAPVINGEKYFRLKSTLVSSGDLYESEQSGFAFALGPDSDVARARISYFDKTQLGSLNQMTIGIRGGFSGLIQVRNDEVYTPSNVPGRILFAPADNYPLAFSTGGAVNVIAPVFDIIQYLSAPPVGLAVARNDKVYDFEYYPGAAYEIQMPYYGREYGFIQARDVNATGAHLAINGINWRSNGSTFTSKPILADVAIGAGVDKIIRSSVDGDFDYIQLLFTQMGAGAKFIPTRAVFSDIPQ